LGIESPASLRPSFPTLFPQCRRMTSLHCPSSYIPFLLVFFRVRLIFRYDFQIQRICVRYSHTFVNIDEVAWAIYRSISTRMQVCFSVSFSFRRLDLSGLVCFRDCRLFRIPRLILPRLVLSPIFLSGFPEVGEGNRRQKLSPHFDPVRDPSPRIAE